MLSDALPHLAATPATWSRTLKKLVEISSAVIMAHYITAARVNTSRKTRPRCLIECL